MPVLGKNRRTHTNWLTDGLGEDDLWPLAVVTLGLNPSDGFPARTAHKLVDLLWQKYDPNPF